MCELTPMQAACWFGRSNEATLGGVSAHLYSEFDGQNIHLEKLNWAIKQLYQRHDMLRLQLDADAIPAIVLAQDHWTLEIDDLSHDTFSQQQTKLAQKRQDWTHQQLDLTQAQNIKWSISLLSDQKFRLHIDADMIAVDPSSFRILVEDLAYFYEHADIPAVATTSFFKWHTQLKQHPSCQKQRKRDRLWWKAQLPHIAAAPSLPYKQSKNLIAQSQRLSTVFNAQERSALQQLSQQHALTFSQLLMGIFAYCLGTTTQDAAYRLNIPCFWREPILSGIEHTVGDFANTVILSVDMTQQNNLAQFCQNLARQFVQGLGHSQYAGVQIMRDLSRYHGTAQIAPVVFTAAVDFPEGELFSERVHRHFGAMNWTISQGPQVALDAQAVNLDGQLLINWDIRLDALPESWIKDLFEYYRYLLKLLASNSALFIQDCSSLPIQAKPIEKSQTRTPLNALQQAYLLGRGHVFPLGGVAMQEYREYVGTLQLTQFKQRLADMVRKHDSLRTYIDEKRLSQYISDDVVINWTEINLIGQSQSAIAHQLTQLRENYPHALFDLTQPPWNITTLQLDADQFVIFVRFDALILDGRAIAELMVELFSNQAIEPAHLELQTKTHAISSRHDDQIYWQNKLAKYSEPPNLAWIKPLHHIATSNYERKSLLIHKDSFDQLSKLGAQQGLFKNSLIMALLLEMLARQTSDLNFCAAIPVLPIYTSALSNQSTFIVTTWQAGATFVQHAQQLQKEVLESLRHLSFSGVDLARLLFEQHHSAPALPVVITNGLSWPNLPDTSSVKYSHGLTQTPQVAIDIRFRQDHQGALIFDIDYAKAAISASFIDVFLSGLEKTILHVIHKNLDNDALQLHFDHLQHQPIKTRADGHTSEIYSNLISSEDVHRYAAIWQVYAQHLNVPATPADYTLQLSHLGLRPSHLKHIAKQINETFSTRLTPLQLIQCNNVIAVEQLISTHTQQAII